MSLSRSPFLAAAAIFAFTQAANAVPIMLDSPVESATGSSVLGPVTRANSISFTNIATDNGTTVDLRVTASVKDQTLFPSDQTTNDAGYLANYNSSAAEPNDDLGFIYYGENLNSIENGISLTFDFFDGTESLSGTFSDALTVSELNFAVYDVDGEGQVGGEGGSTQSEFFRAYLSDGLVSYQLGDTPQALAASRENLDTIRFDGVGENFSESDISGAAILNYINVSSFSLDFGSVMTAGSVLNPVFSGFDGDLSLFDVSDFLPPVAATAVPLPAGLPLMLMGVSSFLLLRRRLG